MAGPPWLTPNLIETYLSGPAILDIRFNSGAELAGPFLSRAAVADLDYTRIDGRGLACADFSQDAVIAADCLDHVPDAAPALREWFRVLRLGGHLLIAVTPRPASAMLSAAADQRFYSPATLLAEIEAALPPGCFAVRHLEVTAPFANEQSLDELPPAELVARAASPSAGRIILILKKHDTLTTIASESSRQRDNSAFGGLRPGSPNGLVQAQSGGSPRIQILKQTPWDLALYDFRPAPTAQRRVVALQLGHLGDFIIGLPALRALRAAFPNDSITLVVGTWNRAPAEACGLVDEVKTHNYFPEIARGWDGKPVQTEADFARLTDGEYDIAIDLRVDEDTRHLLRHVNAATRAGIGLRTRFPFLDVALPFDQTQRLTDTVERTLNVLLGPERFFSRMPTKGLFKHETDFLRSNAYIIYGPYIRLPEGRYRVVFGIEMKTPLFRRHKLRVTLDAVQGVDRILAKRVLGAGEIGAAPNDKIFLDFDNTDPDTACEFRIHIAGRTLGARLGFSGVRIVQVKGEAFPSIRSASLHIGEQQTLLVQLLAERTRALYPPAPATLPPDLTIPQARHRIIVAPVSNSDLRDWPADQYAALIARLTKDLDCVVVLTGAPSQSPILARIATASNAGGRVVNLAGKLAWRDMPALLRTADLVICNNSGIAHVAAAAGARTLAIYSASHQPQEWGPRGVRARAMMAMVPCSPCGHDRLADCPFDHACMVGLTPAAVFDQASSWLVET